MADNTPSNHLSEYTSENIRILRGPEHIRMRPAMYIGDVGPTGLHHLAFELVYNAIDEATAGCCLNIHVRINGDGSLSVRDDGRGIPVETNSGVGRSTLEVVMTMIGAGAKIDHRKYKVAAGLRGMGAKAVTALSDWSEAEVWRNGRVYQQRYERGESVADVCDIGAAGTKTGTKITFHPDPQIFHDVTFDWDRLETHLRELAFLNKCLTIKLSEERRGKEETFHYPRGVAEFVEYLNRAAEVLHRPIHIGKTVDDVQVEVALQYTTGEEERVRYYSNNYHNEGGGTHQSGFRAGVTSALEQWGTKEDLKLLAEDYRTGLTAVVSLQIPHPCYASANKARLYNSEIEGIVASVVRAEVASFLKDNPAVARLIIKNAVSAAEARETRNQGNERNEHAGPAR